MGQPCDQNAVCAVWLDMPPPSIRQFGWNVELDGAPLWQRCLIKLRQITPAPLVVIGPLGGSSTVAEFCVSKGIEYIESPSTGYLPSIIHVHRSRPSRLLVLVHPLVGVGLVPDEIIQDTLSAHKSHQAHMTSVSELPIPLAVNALGTDILEVIAQLPLEIVQNQDVRTVVDLICRSSDSSSNGLIVHRIPFGRYVKGQSVPAYIPWTCDRDARRIAQALQDAHQQQKPIDALVRLRRLIVRDLEESHRVIRRAPPRCSSEACTILFASNPSAYSGAEECLINTMLALKKTSDTRLHCLIAQEGTFADRAREAGATVYCPQRDFYDMRIDTFLWMWNLLSDVRPDIVHCNAVVGLPLIAAVKAHGIPLVQWARKWDLTTMLDHLTSADMITAVSEFIAEQIGQLMVRGSKVRVLYDCVDTERFDPSKKSPQDVRAKFGIAAGEFVVLCIARFVAYKRHDVLIHAMSKVARQHPKVRLLLIGERHGAVDNFEQVVRALDVAGVKNQTTILGFQADVLSFEAAADAVVLCSEREALGTVVLEAMALGKPVIVAASGGLPEMIEDGVSGLHCVPGDPESLASKLGYLIKHPEVGPAFGRKARARVKEQFSLQSHARRVLAFYDEIAPCVQSQQQHKSQIEGSPRVL